MISTSFILRAVSSVILAPLTLAAIIYGGFAFQMFVALAFGLSVREWVNMARKSDHTIRDAVLGVVYLGLCFTAFMKLRIDLDQGLFLTFCLMLGVWASDIGAYFSGKFIGGPKLAVKISPNKTWAGFVGGMVSSALTLAGLNMGASALSEFTGMELLPFAPSMEMALIIGALFTVIGQIGDLMISSYKRHVGVKDTGNLIPGHGGLLDRIDSLLLVTPFFLLVLTELF